MVLWTTNTEKEHRRIEPGKKSSSKMSDSTNQSNPEGQSLFHSGEVTHISHSPCQFNFFHRSLKKKRGESNTSTLYSPYQNFPPKKSFESVETQVCLLTVKEFLKNSQEQQVGP